MTLEARSVTFGWRERLTLEGASLRIAPGEIVALLGPNGAGKSTLLRVLSGDLTPRAGDVVVDGVAVSTLGHYAMSKRRAVLTQSLAVVFDFTAGEIVLLGRTPFHRSESKSRSREVAHSALEFVGAGSFADRPISTLSGGERQRVHLARALAQVWEPVAGGSRYLLLDEPVSAFDVSWQHETLDLLRGLAQSGFGVLTILHDLNLAAHYADRLAFLSDGRVVADGRSEEVLTPGLIHQVYGVHATVCPHPVASCPLVVHHGVAPTADRSSGPVPCASFFGP